MGAAVYKQFVKVLHWRTYKKKLQFNKKRNHQGFTLA
jgi:hypothetical protein